ncbi:TIGR00282 family metallophosphoesterase [bacterium]|nr:TIGR00282 family metallophosphoesterase [bacterium]
MRVLFIGDIFGKPGRMALYENLTAIKEDYSTDFVIANAENIAGGFGITENLCKKLFRYGVDIITTGNHVWDRQDIDSYLEVEKRVLRPLNFPAGTPGFFSTVIQQNEAGAKLAVINAQGRIFMRAIDDPFRGVLAEVERLRKITPNIIVDFHAEATSEKVAMAYFLDGKVSAVFGTHTHVQTSDERILEQGTAALTDAGMTGPHDSVIGVRSELALRLILTGRNVRFSPASKNIRIQGCIVDIDEGSGKALSIERIDISVEESKNMGAE